MSYGRGLDVLGAGGHHFFSRWNRQVAPTVIVAPNRVVALPHNAAHITLDGVARVIVSGGNPWVPVWDKNDTEFNDPTAVVVEMMDGSRQVFSGLQSLSVYGGQRATTVLGAAPSFGLPSLKLDPSLASTVSAAPSSASLSPEELSKLDRALTPEEYKRVEAWQSAQAAAMQAAEEKKGGPKATMEVTPKGATVVVVDKPTPGAPAAEASFLDKLKAIPDWQKVLGIFGVAAIGYGAYRVAR